MKTDYIRRRFLCVIGLAGVPALSACSALPVDTRERPAGKANGFGTLRLDANPEKTAVTIYDEKGARLAAAAVLSKKISGTISGGSRAIPRFIRVTWRTGEFRLAGDGTWTGGTVMGDYTAAVAERIPREVFDYMRRRGGSLRLKLRVVDGAVLVAWDVEKYVSAEGWKPGDGDSGFHYHMVSGDFREDKVVNGKIVEPGWERIPPTASGAR